MQPALQRCHLMLQEKCCHWIFLQNYHEKWVVVVQSCPILCNPRDCSPPGSSLHGISQARILECLAMSSSRASSRPRNGTGSPVSWADPKLAHPFLITVGYSDTYWLIGIFAAAAAVASVCVPLCVTRILEWVAISFSNAWKWKVKVKSLSHVRLLATPRIAAYHAPLFMGFSRQGYWSGVPLPSPNRHI